MRKWITLLMTLLAGCGSYANANMGQVTFDAGYRHDTINWSHQFPSTKPFISTNSRFKNIDIFQIGLHGRTTLGCNFYVRGNAYWGWILDGDYERSFKTNFDANSDFYCDGAHFGVQNKHQSTVDDKYVFGVGAAIGYPFYFCDCSIIIAPVIGYAFDEQNLEVDDRDFNINTDSYGFFNCSSSGGCCEYNFVNRWYGPFVGLDFDYRPWNSCLNIWAELEYHWADFSGKRNNFDHTYWFDDRRRSSNRANAWVFGAGVDYDLCNCWTVGISLKFQDWRATRRHKYRECLDEYFLESCNTRDRRIKTTEKWRSYAINLTLGREF